VFDPAIASKLAKCGLTWLDAPADMFPLAFIYLGLDANSHRPEDRAAADAMLMRARPHVRYFHPKEGAPLWSDMVAIPVDARHPGNAYAVLDYLMEPEVIASVTNVVGQANANAASLPHVAEAIRDDPAISRESHS
jgi:putrescine transport system substrate-binding protein